LIVVKSVFFCRSYKPTAEELAANVLPPAEPSRVEEQIEVRYCAPFKIKITKIVEGRKEDVKKAVLRIGIIMTPIQIRILLSVLMPVRTGSVSGSASGSGSYLKLGHVNY
jgi:hypothetical protein